MINIPIYFQNTFGLTEVNVLYLFESDKRIVSNGFRINDEYKVTITDVLKADVIIFVWQQNSKTKFDILKNKCDENISVSNLELEAYKALEAHLDFRIEKQEKVCYIKNRKFKLLAECLK